MSCWMEYIVFLMLFISFSQAVIRAVRAVMEAFMVSTSVSIRVLRVETSVAISSLILPSRVFIADSMAFL